MYIKNQKSINRCLLWFRSDLRITDNPALNYAINNSDEILALFIHQPLQEERHHIGARQKAFINSNLESLKIQLKKIGIELLQVSWTDYSETLRELPEFILQQGINLLVANRENGINENRRDHELRSKLEIPFARFNADCILDYGTVLNGSGEMFRVFTPFRNQWLKILLNKGYALDASPSAIETDENTRSNDFWPPGEVSAQQKLKAFCREQLGSYEEKRDYPATDGTSMLSPYLAIGVLSTRQCLHAIETGLGYLPMSKGEKGFAWLNELVWREFYRHLMHAFQHLSMNRSFRLEMDRVQWQDNPQHLSAWCSGMTGYPIVDAAMRALKKTGWMHNRLRMIVASFLTKDLQIDWREGERYFMQQLIDADFPSNNGGWQWAAGTGADAAPYFRIFNPARQSEKFDSDGAFIRKWIPELQSVPSKHIHQPHTWLTANDQENTYPAPIVDHAIARQQTLARYQSAKTEN